MAPLAVSVVTFEDTQVASPVPTTFNWSAGGRCRKPRSRPGWEVTERSATFLTSPRSDHDAKRAVAIDQALKEYIYAWRNVVVSYERFVETVFSHMMQGRSGCGSCSSPARRAASPRSPSTATGRLGAGRSSSATGWHRRHLVNDLGSPEGRPIGHRTKTGPEPSEMLGERS
jgi:hypothetical protein